MSKDQDRQSVLHSRRHFIRQAACAAVGTSALTNILGDLRLMNAAMAQGALTDYKALVCIFLSGGNDANNLIIPTIASEYVNYATVRGAVAIPLDQVLVLDAANNAAPTSSDGHDYGFHPACPELRQLFGQGKLAPLFNVGSLLFPMTKAEYTANTVARPPQLFSHSDQVTQWQTSIPDRAPLTGWGGRCADLLQSVNLSNGGKISLATSLAGANTFEVGAVTSEYNVSTSGAVEMSLPSSQKAARLSAVQNLINISKTQPNLQTHAYGNVLDNAIATGVLLNTSLTASPNQAYLSNTATFPTKITNPISGTQFGSNLMSQLQMVAKLIDAGSRSTASGGLGMLRQIFFCEVGGYDTHTNQFTTGNTAAGSHSNLLAELSQCFSRFQGALDTIGMTNSVTTFTGSDFGRTFPSNGQGSDHGWGSHHLIMGGAVKGRQTYGTWPTLTVGGPDDTSTGRWIPTTSVDQYSATLASWFGVTDTNLKVVFPNLSRFATRPAFL